MVSETVSAIVAYSTVSGPIPGYVGFTHTHMFLAGSGDPQQEITMDFTMTFERDGAFIYQLENLIPGETCFFEMMHRGTQGTGTPGFTQH